MVNIHTSKAMLIGVTCVVATVILYLLMLIILISTDNTAEQKLIQGSGENTCIVFITSPNKKITKQYLNSVSKPWTVKYCFNSSCKTNNYKNLILVGYPGYWFPKIKPDLHICLFPHELHEPADIGKFRHQVLTDNWDLYWQALMQTSVDKISTPDSDISDYINM